MKTYDVVIIGVGTSGLNARRQVEKATTNYLVVDPGILGTTCARVGCMPSKAFIQVAEDFHRRRVFADFGISGGENLKVDTAQVMKHVRKLRDRFTGGVIESMQEWQNTHFKPKRARFLDAHTLDLEGEEVRAEKIVIATGSSPVIPEKWQAFRDRLVTTQEEDRDGGHLLFASDRQSRKEPQGIIRKRRGIFCRQSKL